MRKGQRWIGHAILWGWLLMLVLAVWPSAATAIGLFAMLVLWEAAQDLKVSRPQRKALRGGRGALSRSPMEPVQHS
jgi:uncharacterized protein (DUF58 family)